MSGFEPVIPLFDRWRPIPYINQEPTIFPDCNREALVVASHYITQLQTELLSFAVYEHKQEQPFQVVGFMNDRSTTKHDADVACCHCSDVHAVRMVRFCSSLFFMFRGLLTTELILYDKFRATSPLIKVSGSLSSGDVVLHRTGSCPKLLTRRLATPIL
jgi:hypothetical protein